jgi:hypothetical protein
MGTLLGWQLYCHPLENAGYSGVAVQLPTQRKLIGSGTTKSVKTGKAILVIVAIPLLQPIRR